MNEQAMNKKETNEQELKELADQLQQSLTPMNRELNRDLWPLMLRRIHADEAPRDRRWLSAVSSVPWFDWALLAALVVGVCIFPKSIPIWLYHF
jgi:hypothetical protein